MSRKRRHKVQLQQPVETTGPYNERVAGVPNVIGYEFAEVETTHGREQERAEQIVGEATHRVTLHANSTTRALKLTDQVLWGELTLGITHIDKSREHLGEIVVLCEEPIFGDSI